MAQHEERKGIFSQIIVTVIITLLVGGTSPWWFDKIFHKNNDNNEIVRSIAELQAKLGENEDQQFRVRREIEHLSTMLETNPDVRQAIQELEQSLHDFTLERKRMEHELGRLHEQR